MGVNVDFPSSRPDMRPYTCLPACEDQLWLSVVHRKQLGHISRSGIQEDAQGLQNEQGGSGSEHNQETSGGHSESR